MIIIIIIIKIKMQKGSIEHDKEKLTFGIREGLKHVMVDWAHICLLQLANTRAHVVLCTDLLMETSELMSLVVSNFFAAMLI